MGDGDGRWQVELRFVNLTDWLVYPIKYKTKENADKAAKEMASENCETRVTES